ncbi:MAG: D-aminoacyl-tRNA deacylase [Eubacteriales bacterium]|nr:D-aminoacyl-tRNA deacylase [Eubacteriales bacterium]
MRAVVQRVTSAQVTIADCVTASIGNGLMVLLGIAVSDTEQDVEYICDKLLGLRIFDDKAGVPNLSVCEVGGSILLVSQFTLMGNATKGRRPSYIEAAKPDLAVPLYQSCISKLKDRVHLECGTFRADMQVGLVNDGPFTILLDSRKAF